MTAHDQYRDDLPLLAAGALPAHVADALQRHIKDCSACRAELADLNTAVSIVGLAQGAVAPPLHLRARILDQVARSVPPGVAVQFDPPQSDRKLQKFPLWTWAPVFAAVVLALLSFVYRQRVHTLETENIELGAKVQNDAALLQRSRALLDTLTAPDALHVTLTAAGKVSPPQAKTIYSSAQHTLVLTANNLSPLAPHKAYQLWLLPAAGAPVPFGTFKPDTHGNAVLVMTAVAATSAPKAFAVTIEPEAGSSAPTSPVVLVGSL